MFEVGKEYRVRLNKEGAGTREGTMLGFEGSMFALNVDDVRTIFHMSSVLYVEMIDKAAEEARDKAMRDSWL